MNSINVPTITRQLGKLVPFKSLSFFSMSNSPARHRHPTGTQIVVEEQPRSQGGHVEVLRLRVRPQKSVDWVEDVVDNEDMNKRSSKICCQYHKPRPFGESTSEEESSSSSSDSDSDPKTKNPEKSKKQRPCTKCHPSVHK
eukprot:Protomagalhaensia_wolfi_Nauph_80__3758@NODE_37_length_4469_cov_110_624153_g29_i0_p3_GENE_NODE_37_length_4469_cov_110_624153_g29_i0NODE_37_length_4469_cov_110_624153_g29_i0_p3_ORF_typecomplete_len141_score16_29PPI_Ypi1/PF07491_11/3_5e22IMUP/PF15761_5/0_0096GEN1_C/PF18380_1/0_02_NODE_37_length_4469_cov_110_624153_g29_i0285707